jgi:hypothetical protein
MRLKVATTAVAMLMLSVLATGSVSANGPGDHPGAGDHPTGPAAGSPSIANHDVRFSARCTPATAGGFIKVQAKLVHGARGKTFTAAATAPFTGGTVAISLRRAGKSFVALGKLAVPAGQATGPIIVTVTILYNGTPSILTCTSQIHPAAVEPDTD